MKTFLSLLSFLAIFTAFSQTIPPPYINYQATLYDVNGPNPNAPYANQSFPVFVNITNELGVLIYKEEHFASTDPNGLVTIKMGDGLYVAGTVTIFNNIPWTVNKYYLTVDFVINGVTSSTAPEQLVTVPYAFHAGTAGNGISSVADNGNGSITFTYVNGSTYTTPVLSGLTGPTGPAGPAGVAGANGKNSLVKTTVEPAGLNCATGGIKTEYGVDQNSNGILDLTEINAALTRYVCNGAQGPSGALSAWSLTGNAATTPATNFIGTTDAQDWIVRTNNLERMRVTSTGNIGVGTVTPSGRLHVVSASGSNVLALDAGTQAQYRFTGNSSSTYITTFNMTDVGLSIGHNSNLRSLNLQTSGLDRLTILPSGYVGIGTTSPIHSFQAENSLGKLYLSAASGATFVERTSGTPLKVLSNSNDNTQNLGIIELARGTGSGESAFITTTGDGTNGVSAVGIGFQTPGIMLRVLNNGNVGIGLNTPTAKLQVNGAATNAQALNAGSSTTIDFSLSNLAYTSALGSAFVLSNLKDGGAYSLIMTNVSNTGVASFTSTGFTFKYMGTGARTSGKAHIYSFIVAGTVVYVSMATEN
jgi:hypothetical protein